MNKGALAAITVITVVLGCIVVHKGDAYIERRALERIVAEHAAIDAAKSPELRRAERELREQYWSALSECHLKAIQKHGASGYDRELDCGHLGSPP